MEQNLLHASTSALHEQDAECSTCHCQAWAGNETRAHQCAVQSLILLQRTLQVISGKLLVAHDVLILGCPRCRIGLEVCLHSRTQTH